MGAEFPPPQSEAQGRLSIDYAEVEKVFSLAEDIHQRIQKSKKEKSHQFILFSAGIILTSLWAITNKTTAYEILINSDFLLRGAVIIAINVIAIGGAAMILRLSHSNTTLRSESRALRRVIDLLHELEQDLDRQTAWSPVQRAEFRIRLSRYVVDEK